LCFFCRVQGIRVTNQGIDGRNYVKWYLGVGRLELTVRRDIGNGQCFDLPRAVAATGNRMGGAFGTRNAQLAAVATGRVDKRQDRLAGFVKSQVNNLATAFSSSIWCSADSTSIEFALMTCIEVIGADACRAMSTTRKPTTRATLAASATCSLHLLTSPVILEPQTS
jgi:hypothetical protein